MAARAKVERPGAQRWVPPGAGVDELAEAAAGCEGCELFAPATQVVFSKGSKAPRAVLVGEQPGDVEDRAGAPFVGPAGKLLDKAIAAAGLDFAQLYATNAVKHFRFVERGARRLHQTPEPGHIAACRPWLAGELIALDPELVIALGATAGRALLGPSFRVTKQRGLLVPWPDSADPQLFGDGTGGGRDDAQLLATIHPSAVLRADDRDAAYAGLVADLRVAAEALD